MKTLTMLTAAALIAGISAAGAQNAATPNQKVPPPSSINAGGYTTPAAKSGSETTGAAQAGAAGKMGKTAFTVKGKSRFCIKTPTGKSLNCKYTTMAACQKIAKPGHKVCISNPKIGTTGAGLKSNNSINMQKK